MLLCRTVAFLALAARAEVGGLVLPRAVRQRCTVSVHLVLSIAVPCLPDAHGRFDSRLAMGHDRNQSQCRSRALVPYTGLTERLESFCVVVPGPQAATTSEMGT